MAWNGLKCILNTTYIFRNLSWEGLSYSTAWMWCDISSRYFLVFAGHIFYVRPLRTIALWHALTRARVVITVFHTGHTPTKVSVIRRKNATYIPNTRWKDVKWTFQLSFFFGTTTMSKPCETLVKLNLVIDILIEQNKRYPLVVQCFILNQNVLFRNL